MSRPRNPSAGDAPSDRRSSDAEPRPCDGDAAMPAASWVSPRRGASSPGYRAASDPDGGRLFPTLYDFITLTGAGGSQRKPGTILFFAEDGAWKACVNDKDGGFYAFVSAESLEGLLRAVDRGLAEGKLDWRVAKKWK